MSRIICFALSLLLFGMVSCQQKPVNRFETGSVMKIKMGTIEKITRMTVTRDAVGQGTFAELASGAATTVSPGLLAAGTSKIASQAGSAMDSKMETVAKIRIRIRLDDGEVIEVIQNDVPGLAFNKGDRITVSTGDVPGNVWPD